MKRVPWLAAFGLMVAVSAMAGPNADGVLLLHAERSITYTADTDYCGQSTLTDCEEVVATVSADPDSMVVFFTLVAFPAEANPQLKALVFGIEYDEERLALVDHGACAGFELSDNG